MNCFEWLEKTKNYSAKIWKEYFKLFKLESRGKKDTAEYKKTFDYVQDLVEMETILYNMMSEHELDFIYNKIDKKYDLTHFTIVNILKISYQPEDYIMIRTGLKALDFSVRKKYGSLSRMKEQLGMIPLVPVDENNAFLRTFQKMNLIWGNFHSVFCYQLSDTSVYDKEFSNLFFYCASFTNTSIENYFLHTKFNALEESTVNLSKSISDVYLFDEGEYSQYCFQFFSNYCQNILYDLSNVSIKDFEYEEDYYMLLKIYSDILYAIIATVPFIVAGKYYDMIIKANIKDEVRLQLLSKLNPLMEDKNEKIIKKRV